MHRLDDHQLRLIRFFLPRLTERELRVEIDAELKENWQQFESEIANLKAKAEEQKQSLRDDLTKVLSEQDSYFWFYVLMIPLLGLGLWLLWRAHVYRNEIQYQTLDDIERVDIELDKNVQAVRVIEREKTSNLEGIARDLYDAYAESVATAEEVEAHTNDLLDRMRSQVADVLGLEEGQILDSECVDVVLPTTFAVVELPHVVIEDMHRTTRLVCDSKDAIIRPIVERLKERRLREAFIARIIRLLGLDYLEQDNENLTLLHTFHAIRFNPTSERLLVGHCSLQRMMCAPDFVGVFQAFVNVILPSFPFTAATHLFYQEIVAIRIETHNTQQRYRPASLEIAQHTRSLVLDMSDGSSYRLSADAGSSVYSIDGSESSRSGGLTSSDGTFSNQIENLRALIRDTRRHLLHLEASPLPEPKPL